MKQAIEAYLAVPRTSGFELTNDDYLLHSYARFAAERGESRVYTATALAWAARSTSVVQRDVRLKSVCRFARFVRLEDEGHELPPTAHFACRKTRRLPYLYSDAELERLIGAAAPRDRPGTNRFREPPQGLPEPFSFEARRPWSGSGARGIVRPLEG